LNPSTYQAWGNRGISLHHLDRYEEALASFDKVIELNPDDDKAWVKRGQALLKLNRPEESFNSYDKAIELNANNHFAWYDRACVHSLLGEIDLALADLTVALCLNPEEFRTLAVTDPDLELLREDPRFGKLLE
jgi:tetratricopeptide (TPR) repeat protein